MNSTATANPTATAAPRVLHLTGNLNRGGIETWLLSVARALPREELGMDILVTDPAPHPGELDAAFAEAGVRVLRAPGTGRALAYAAFLWRVLKAGRYDAVHSHVHHFGGFALLLARSVGVPLRAATSHNDTARADRAASRARRAYLALARAAMRLGANDRSAVSAEAAAALFGPRWERECELIALGIDLAALRAVDPERRAALRAELRLTPPVFVHVGQFRAQKNHTFLLEVFARYRASHGPATLLLAGDGDERPAAEARARELGVLGAVRFVGSHPEVPALLSLGDAFVFPSHFEGLGLALLEAQAVGLPCVVSDRVPLHPPASGNTRALPPGDAERWADALAAALSRGRQPLDLDLDVRHTARALAARYRGRLTASARGNA